MRPVRVGGILVRLFQQLDILVLKFEDYVKILLNRLDLLLFPVDLFDSVIYEVNKVTYRLSFEQIKSWQCATVVSPRSNALQQPQDEPLAFL